MIVDSHHHFWSPHPYKYPWMTSEFAPINRKFVQADLDKEMSRHEVAGSVVVQTYSSLGETLQFLELAASTPSLLGVVGWFDMLDPDIGETMDTVLRSDHGKFLVGVRHQVHDEEDAKWLERDDVLHALGQITQRDICFDLLIRPRELASALVVARRFPELTFVVDHIAKPEIKNRMWSPWAEGMASLAELPNVYCKLSGVITEANWHSWILDEVRPYVAHCIDLFGPQRCMFGSDWPVCLLAGKYSDTLEVVRNAASDLSEDERDQILSRAAIEAYRLKVEDSL